MAVVIVLYVGFFITGAILTGESLAALLHVTLAEGIWIGSAIAFIMTYFGYEFIHRYDKVGGSHRQSDFHCDHDQAHHGSSGPSCRVRRRVGDVVLLMVSIAATWQLTWAPYVSDYSRYLPVNTSTVQTFWFTYVGSAVAGVWLMVVGILAGTVAGSALSIDPAGYIGTLFPGAHWLAYIGIAASLLIIQAMSLYSGFLAIMGSLFASTKVPNAVNSRIVASLVIGVGGSIAAVAASGNFITNFTNFLLFLLYLLVPWTAINLMDFYVVRKGQYSIPDFFKSFWALRQSQHPNHHHLCDYVCSWNYRSPTAVSTRVQSLSTSWAEQTSPGLSDLIVAAGPLFRVGRTKHPQRNEIRACRNYVRRQFVGVMPAPEQR